MSARARLLWLLTAALAAAAFVGVGVVALRTGRGMTLDELQRGFVLNGMPAGPRRLLDALARPWLLIVLAPLDVALALLAAVRGAWRRVLAALVVVAASTALTLGLDTQSLLGLPDDGYPSDHATIGFALLAAATVLWPRPLGGRGLVAATAIAAVIATGNVSWYAHRPSDVVGGALVVLSVTGLMFALLGGDVANLRPGSEPD